MKTPIYGPLRAHDTNAGERNLKIKAVRPSKTYQERDDSILKQEVSLRHTEAMFIDNIRTSNKVQKTNSQHGGARIQNNIPESLGRLQVVFESEIVYCIIVKHRSKAQETQM